MSSITDSEDEEGEEDEEEENEEKESSVDEEELSGHEKVEIVWAKANRGVWGLGHVINDKLYLTRDLVDRSELPTILNLPESAPAQGPKAGNPQGKGPNVHRQEFKMKYKKGKGWYSEPC